MKPFCMNPKCMLNHVEVPDDQTKIEVNMPDQIGGTREFFRCCMPSIKENRKFLFCDTCINIVEFIKGGSFNVGIPANMGLAMDHHFWDQRNQSLQTPDQVELPDELSKRLPKGAYPH